METLHEGPSGESTHHRVVQHRCLHLQLTVNWQIINKICTACPTGRTCQVTLVRGEAHVVPLVFSTFFPTPRFSFDRSEEDLFRSEFTESSMNGWNLGHASSYCLEFLSTLSSSKKIETQLGRIRMKELSGPLTPTVLASDIWIAFYHIAAYAWSNYRRWPRFLFATWICGASLARFGFADRRSISDFGCCEF